MNNATLSALVAAGLRHDGGFLRPGMVRDYRRKVVNRRRSKTLFQVATIAVVLGGLPMILDELFLLLMGGGVGMLLGMLWPGIYIFLAASSTYVRLSGIQLRR